MRLDLSKLGGIVHVGDIQKDRLLQNKLSPKEETFASNIPAMFRVKNYGKSLRGDLQSVFIYNLWISKR